MLMPSIARNNLFDDLFSFDFPEMRDFADFNNKCYSRNAAQVMKTDIHEHEDKFVIDIDLPGFKKDEIKLDLENGYLKVAAVKTVNTDKKSDEGKVLCRERYTGSMQRSFFVGKQISHDDIKARFEDGVLKLEIFKAKPVIPEKKTIHIAG